MEAVPLPVISAHEVKWRLQINKYISNLPLGSITSADLQSSEENRLPKLKQEALAGGPRVDG